MTCTQSTGRKGEEFLGTKPSLHIPQAYFCALQIGRTVVIHLKVNNIFKAN